MSCRLASPVCPSLDPRPQLHGLFTPSPLSWSLSLLSLILCLHSFITTVTATSPGAGPGELPQSCLVPQLSSWWLPARQPLGSRSFDLLTHSLPSLLTHSLPGSLVGERSLSLAPGITLEAWGMGLQAVRSRDGELEGQAESVGLLTGLVWAWSGSQQRRGRTGMWIWSGWPLRACRTCQALSGHLLCPVPSVA